MLIDFLGVFVFTFDELSDVVVKDLHHVLLVPNSIFVEELLWKGPHAEGPLEMLLCWRIHISKSDLASIFVSQDSHHVDKIGTHPEILLAASIALC